MLHTFWCDQNLDVVRTEGGLADWLECDTDELEAQQWRRWISSDDEAVIQQTLIDLRACRTGNYHVCAVARNGERLYLATRTMLIFERGEVRAVGQTSLEAWDTPRTRIFLSAIQIVIYAVNLLPAIL